MKNKIAQKSLSIFLKNNSCVLFTVNGRLCVISHRSPSWLLRRQWRLFSCTQQCWPVWLGDVFFVKWKGSEGRPPRPNQSHTFYFLTQSHRFISYYLFLQSKINKQTSSHIMESQELFLKKTLAQVLNLSDAKPKCTYYAA